MIIEKACPDCAQPAIFDFYEAIRNNQLFWSASLTCPACGCAIEMDDKGSLPEDLRSRIIAEEGLWEIEISSMDAYAAKAIHQVMNIPLKELVELKKQIPFVVYQGTETEARFYFNSMFMVAKIDALMRKAD